MSRQPLTEAAQLLGVTKSLKTIKRKHRAGEPCPFWLIPSLEKRKAELELKLRRPSTAEKLRRLIPVGQ